VRRKPDKSYVEETLVVSRRWERTSPSPTSIIWVNIIKERRR